MQVNGRGRPLTIGFAQGVMNHPFRLASVESMKAAARRAGVRLLVTDGRGDADVEAENVAWLLEQHVDAVIISSLSGQAMHPTYVRVTERQVPLVLFASGVPDDDTPYTAYVGADDVAIGRQAAEYLGARLGGQGRVLHLRGLEASSNSRLRGEGFSRRLAESSPDVEVVASLQGDWLRRSAYDATDAALAQHQDIDAIFSENDEMALGAVDVVRARGLQSRVVVVGLDGQAEATWEISLGPPLVMTVSIDWDASPALEVALRAARGDDVAPETYLASMQVEERSAMTLMQSL